MKIRILLLALTVAGCAAPPAGDPVAALRPYYRQLAAELPTLPPGPALDVARPLTRIAFGSCSHQERSQAHWDAVAATAPQLFVAIGDNVYGDVRSGNASMPELRAAYGNLSASAPFRALRAQTPMLATWDDHDYGFNDAGGDYLFREYAERIFETYFGASAAVKARPGIYDSVTVGPPGQRVQFIMLDTRYFRSPLKSLPDTGEWKTLGRYLPNDDPSATVLGEAQWRWLEAELRKPADLRVMVSSIQVIATNHQFELWANMPVERRRLMNLIDSTDARNLVIISGDRHLGALYAETTPGGRRLDELTASALNMNWAKPGHVDAEDEPVANRVGGVFRQANFGTLDIDWNRRTATLRLLDMDRRTLVERQVGFGS